jgi:hypothetical protein
MLAFQHPFFGLLPKEFVARKKETFTYNIRFNTIAASATNVGTANVDNASDFVWVAASVVVTNAAFTTFTNAANVPMLVEIKDASSGIDFQDSATHVSNIFGTAQNPFLLLMPKIFRAGGQITARLQNQDAANAFVVNFAFHGFKVYGMPA